MSAAVAATPSHPNPLLRSMPKKKSMSITQTYYLAHKARAKLSREAAQPDHDLRLLVGHANLLDSLMFELADAEREQERWFNQSVRGASKSADRRVQWADRIVEQVEEDEFDDSDSSDASSDSGSESELDYEGDDVEMTNAVSSRVPVIRTVSVDEDEAEMGDDLEEDYAQLELVRTPSHSSSPPELVDYDSESSDDDSMPPSPADATLSYDEKDVGEQDALYEHDGYYASRRTPAGLVSAISVY
ncbi:hypothetical protein DCS_01167 [Drechmeria coniospora]|uniref:Protein ECM13 n=1 Tax=Drechmeria coniospora TaxID=98403 RepID=A0A151GSI1_DRECN|nr:hypothetical protein DCS_01167 [Drechmeria coniospora]KYK60033.1 hypothetical protein DCS_01167 [Drechmeria coniospora]